MQLHQQKGMISLSPPTICNSAIIIGRIIYSFILNKSFLSFDKQNI
nr:hypothetical protein [Proteus mirabilis]